MPANDKTAAAPAADDIPEGFWIPEGHQPEEFLNDARLAEYHAWKLSLDPENPDLIRRAAKAQVAAMHTAGAVLEAEAESRIAIAEAAAAAANE